MFRYVNPPRINSTIVEINVGPGPKMEIIFPAIGGISVPERCSAAIIIANALTSRLLLIGRTEGTIACPDGPDTVVQKPTETTKTKIYMGLT